MFQQAFYCVACVNTIWPRELNDIDIYVYMFLHMVEE